MDKYFLIQIKRTNGTIDKGVVVKDTLDAARQSYHAYLGAYAYGQNPDTDYVCVEIIDSQCNRYDWNVWEKAEEQEQANE